MIRNNKEDGILAGELEVNVLKKVLKKKLLSLREKRKILMEL
jgi:hypothetical protein